MTETIGDGDRLFESGCRFCGQACDLQNQLWNLASANDDHPRSCRSCREAVAAPHEHTSSAGIKRIASEVGRRLSLAAKAHAEKWEPKVGDWCVFRDEAPTDPLLRGKHCQITALEYQGDSSRFTMRIPALEGSGDVRSNRCWAPKSSMLPLQPPPPPVGSELPLYVPKHGETVRVIEVSTKDPTPKLKVGDVLTLNGDSHATVQAPGFIWLEATYCRVEKVEASIDDGSGYRCPLCASGKRCGCGDMLRAAEKQIAANAAQAIRAGGGSSKPDPDPYAKHMSARLRGTAKRWPARPLLGPPPESAVVDHATPSNDTERDRLIIANNAALRDRRALVDLDRLAAHRRHLDQLKKELGRKVEPRHPSDWDPSEGSESELRVTS